MQTKETAPSHGQATPDTAHRTTLENDDLLGNTTAHGGSLPGNTTAPPRDPPQHLPQLDPLSWLEPIFEQTKQGKQQHREQRQNRQADEHKRKNRLTFRINPFIERHSVPAIQQTTELKRKVTKNESM